MSAKEAALGIGLAVLSVGYHGLVHVTGARLLKQPPRERAA